MHHYIFPTYDSFISSKDIYDNRNFGVDELLMIGTEDKESKILRTEKSVTYSTPTTIGCPVSYLSFSGSLSGSFSGSMISGSAYVSGSGLDGNISGSNSFSSSVVLSGSISSSTMYFFSGSIYEGTATVYGAYYTTQTEKVINRSLVKFNLDAISASVANGEMASPKFHLNLKLCNSYQLPLAYNIYAFPISQSWANGVGYYSDGGDLEGVSWIYRDGKPHNSLWYTPYDSSSRVYSDYFNNSAYATASFSRGGGTWYYTDGTSSLQASQSFVYENADIDMDVSTIVYSWLSGSIPNNGFILMSSDEVSSSVATSPGTLGYILSFYSKDTNTIYSPYLDVMWDDSTWTTGSVTTASVEITTYRGPMVSGSLITGSSLTGSSISGSVRGYVFLNNLDPFGGETNVSGLVAARGTSGTVTGIEIEGSITGSHYQGLVQSGSYAGSTFTQSFIDLTIISGPFSGSTISASYDTGSFVGTITGSWSETNLSASIITGSLDGPIARVRISGSEIDGNAIGTIAGTVDGGTFQGSFIDGRFAGSNVYAPFIGTYSYLTSSLSVTSSVTYSTASVLLPLQFSRSISVAVQNLKNIYKSGDIPRIDVFAREEFPLKTFNKATQQSEYLIPKYLPTSSYYAIKDNETEEMIVDFDSYTKLSCDDYGNYFYLDTTGLAQERYYRVLIRTTKGRITYTFDNGNMFKITR